MFARLLKFVLQLALLQCISGRLSVGAKFYGQPSEIIVDNDKPRLNSKLQNALYYNIPVYKLINPSTGNPTAKTTMPMVISEYPSDVLHIARTRLGLKRMDQLPSISELGKLLGTGNADETIKYVRFLMSNDQGIELMKTYLESFDYEQAANDNTPREKDDESDNFTNNADIDVDYDEATSKLNIPTKMKSSNSELEEASSMQRFNEFVKQYSFWPGSSTTPRPLPYKRVLMPPVQPTQQRHGPAMRPVLVRQPLPYHFPVPLRSALMSQPVKSTSMPTLTNSTTNSNRSTHDMKPPHLNTPKQAEMPSPDHVAPHVQQLAQMANISPQVLDQFLQQQPKLAELAKRLSRLPLVQQHSQTIDSQLLLAVKTALFQDENLKSLLGASQTLK
ncbi:uncharacterized protein link [Drosophila virilis]|uniref:Uncharacterized protein n=1 Tax=Drosophila virilis TaxID=7244 RepID=B4MCN1_DROVI|nr:uncharacterized protein LOC6635335 [Drosophila virilis]EDW71419.1 uncharacterized protein Dvir_GJ19763 [Drosophila virilis]